ncbi:tetratricopeptide repeat protein [Allorhizocola rhizosphaerae]|uniref:tetratricopeptide repeat protein n=1 Tax=Allorhizocola rhizosphaerae TaxID=1872709 RepID=UPI000E3C095E|nr:tetratricopeptide repeat protein [Allorhizocola rhizosphaerae]
MREQLVQGWMLLADGKIATARRMFADTANLFWGRFGLAEATLAAGHPAAAVHVFAEAEELVRDRPLLDRTPAIARRAVCLALAGEPEYAGYLCESTLKELGAECFWLSCAGIRCWTSDRRRSAARSALALAESIDARRAADTYHQFATTLRRKGRHDEAVSNLERAVELLARARLAPELALCHLTRAEELATQQRLAEAIDHAERALQLCGSLEAMCVLADLHRRAMRFDEAQRLAQRAHDSAADQCEVGLTTRVLGLIANDCGQPTGETLLRQSAEAYARAGKPLEVAESCRILGRQLAGQARVEEALSCFDQACATVLSPA